MAEIAIMVLDPGGNRFAELVDDRLPVRSLIPPLVERLGLVRELNYLLVLSGESHGLPVDRSLSASDVPAGAKLYLIPARDSVFDAALRKIYEEAKEYSHRQLWEDARHRLERLYRTEPRYPDPAGLTQTVPGAPAPFDASAESPSPASRWRGRPRPRRAPAPPTPSPGPSEAATTTSQALRVLIVVMVIGVIVAYINRDSIEQWVKIGPNAKQENKNANGNPNSVGQSGGGQNQRGADARIAYGVFVVGADEEVVCGQRGAVEDGFREKPGTQIRLVLGPFNSADETRRAYESDKIPGSERTVGGVKDEVTGVTLMGQRVARFQFDGREHRFDNAFRYLR